MALEKGEHFAGWANSRVAEAGVDPSMIQASVPGSASKNLSENNIPSFGKGSCEKIQWREAKAPLVVRGRSKFTLPKPGGRSRTVKHFPGFRRATRPMRETG